MNIFQRFLAPWRSPSSVGLTQGAVSLDGTDSGDANKYRRLTAQDRDLTPLKLARIQNLSYALWQRNPLARRLISILVDFTVGTDFNITAKIVSADADGKLVDTDKADAQEVWELSWNDPYSGLSDDSCEIVTDYFLNGELAIVPAVNPLNGKVTWGFINPSNIRKVITDPLNAFQPLEIVVAEKESVEGRTLKVIAPDKNPKSETYGRLMGDVLFFRTNKLISQSRGCGELAEMLDWIDLLEKFQWNALESAEVRNMFFFHEQREGWDQEKLDKLLPPAPPKTATVRVTNEKVKIDIKNPDLSSYETDRIVRTFKDFVLAGKGLPAHYFGDGGDANLATAGEMGRPTMQMFKRKQREVKVIFQRIAAYVCDQAVISGKLKLSDGEQIEIEVNAYDFDRKDAATVGVGFVQVVTALKLARDANWIGDAAAKSIVDNVVVGLGVTPNPDQTTSEIAEENSANRAAAPYSDLPINEFLNRVKKEKGDMVNA